MENLLQNKYVLYLVLFIAVTNVLGYLAIEDFNSLMVFIEGLKNKDKDKKKKDVKEQMKSRFASSRPAKAARAATEEEEDEVDSTRIDYAATMEQAYDNLNKMLGDGGMKNLTKDTKGLMDQQKELMGQLKDFAPLMEQAGSMLDKLGGMDNLKGLMGKMGGIKLPNGKKK